MGKEEIVFIDANIFLELILNDKKADICEIFLRKVENGEITAETSDFILYTCLIKIEDKLKSKQPMQKFISSINELGLDIIRPSLKEIDEAIKISEKHKLDFDDSLVVSCMVNNNIKKLISFDGDFDKVKIIKRIEPY